MKIYVAHASSFDFQHELYDFLRKSRLNKRHEFILPHEHSSEPQNSKEKIREYDLVLAEVSYPSTGMGIELGWADAFGIPIVCVHRKDAQISSSLKTVTNVFLAYEDLQEMAQKIESYLSYFPKNS